MEILVREMFANSWLLQSRVKTSVLYSVIYTLIMSSSSDELRPVGLGLVSFVCVFVCFLN